MSIAVAEFAGRTSAANLVLQVAAHVNLTVCASITLAGFSMTLYVMEFKRHRKTLERLTARITLLEKDINPGRTSSSLTKDGMTQEEDR
jgi:hypothetical protein